MAASVCSVSTSCWRLFHYALLQIFCFIQHYKGDTKQLSHCSIFVLWSSHMPVLQGEVGQPTLHLPLEGPSHAGHSQNNSTTSPYAVSVLFLYSSKLLMDGDEHLKWSAALYGTKQQIHTEFMSKQLNFCYPTSWPINLLSTSYSNTLRNQLCMRILLLYHHTTCLKYKWLS